MALTPVQPESLATLLILSGYEEMYVCTSFTTCTVCILIIRLLELSLEKKAVVK